MKKILLIFYFCLPLFAFAQSSGEGNGQVSSIESVTSIESTLKIFPNPAKSVLNINMRIPSVTQARVSMHDMLGNEVEVLSENASGAFEKSFDINGLRSGIYFVRINFNNGQSTIVKKIIVQ